MEAQEDLHDTLFVCNDDGREGFTFGVEGDFTLFALFLLVDVGVRGEELDLLVESFHSLDAHDLLYALDDVEWCYVLSEFIRFNLCVVEKILHYESHETS